MLLKAEDAANLPLLAKTIYDAKLLFIQEVIATEIEILLQLNDNYRDGMESQLTQLQLTDYHQSRNINLPIYFYDHVDWEYVINFTGLTKAEYISQIIACKLKVAMYGFMPGFIYLSGLPSHLQVPRKESPVSQLAKNSFALGGPYFGIYSLPSPGGWYVLGELLLPIINTSGMPPLKLDVGDTISIISIDYDESELLRRQNISLEQYNGWQV
jgi:inhibitor of KinA